MSSADADFLATVGRRVRALRERRGMARKVLAREADVSERYLGQLEGGEGNISILLLRRVANALNVTLPELLSLDDDGGVEKRLIRRFLERLPAQRLEEVVFRLMRDFSQDETARRRRVALIGVRGAGKSTLGAMLAKDLRAPFVELNREIEGDAGMPVAEVIALYGQRGYRRMERRALERVLREHEQAVISVGGGMVSEEETFRLLLAHCFTVWIKASPEEHMSRVVSQGDLRPMAGHDEAMEDLKRIIEAREELYRKADAVVDTSGERPDASARRLKHAVTMS